MPPSILPQTLREGTMIWKRSAVLRFYSVCGLLLQGNPRPAVGSITSRPFPILPIPPRISTLPWQSPSARRFPLPPPPPGCCRGQWQFAPAGWFSSAGSAQLWQQAAPYAAPFAFSFTRAAFIPPDSIPASIPLPLRVAGNLCLSQHSILPPTLASHLPHHALKRCSPPLVISLTSSPFRVAFLLSLLPTSISSMCL